MCLYAVESISTVLTLILCQRHVILIKTLIIMLKKSAPIGDVTPPKQKKGGKREARGNEGLFTTAT